MDKTKTMVFVHSAIDRKISVEGIEIEKAGRFTHFESSVVQDLDCKKISVQAA